ncbi:unnamed protein product [Meloidogyne enterolobii]|uniref:Uncharacterized protein n=1 Tax=Meloidogyne enterolobii TaxID=390850 RepID=A0ACB0ZP09_MELEN
MFDFPVKVLSAVSGVLQPPATTQLDQQQSNLMKGCLSKHKASKGSTSFTSQHPKLVYASPKPSFDEIYTEDKQQNSLWFAAPGAVLHFGLFCMDSLPRLRAECISWLFHYGVYTNWWGKFFVEVLNQHFASKMCQKNLDSAFIILSCLCSETVKYPRLQTNIIEQLVLSVLTQLGVSSADNGINISTLSWLFLGGDFGPVNETAPIVDEGQNQFFDNLIDTTLSEATTMTAANFAPCALHYQNVKVTESASNLLSEICQFDPIALQMFNASRLNLANNINIQPIALSVDLQYGFCVSEKQAITDCNDSVFLQDTLIRNSFRRLLLLRSLSPSNSSNDDNILNEEKRDEAIGQCMQTIMGAIDQLFANLRADSKNSNVRPAFVERLLDFYWQYQSDIDAFLNSKSNLSIAKSPLFTVPALSDNAACSFISYAADNPFISELVWTRVLTTLNTSIQKMVFFIKKFLKFFSSLI